MSRRDRGPKRHTSSNDAAPPDGRGSPDRSSSNRSWLIVPLVLLICALAFAGYRTKFGRTTDGQGPGAAATSSPESSIPVPLDKLVGIWERTDGSYALELTDPAEGGKLSARYFNPNPINVGNAEWRQDKGELLVFVELRDANYPGSTYALKYAAGVDQLSGTYYQATAGDRFDVEFVRASANPP